MASFSAGTTFTDGVANDVTAAKLGALVNNATPTSGLIQDRTAETVTATNDTLLIGDASDSNSLKRITVANFAQTLPTAKVTTGTIETGTFGTTTSTAATITTGTIPTLVATTLVTTGTGTDSSPAISPTGDSNTGVFFPAADTIAFAEGGTEAMRIASSGNIGIGSTAPDEKLTVEGGIQIRSTNKLHFTSTINQATIHAPLSNTIAITTNATERLRIDSSGNVEVKTAGAKIKLARASDASLVGEIGSQSGTGISIKNIGGTTSEAVIGADWFAVNTNNAESLRIDSSGRVGIGTTTQVNRLEIVGSFGRGAPVTKTGDFTLADTENWLIVNKGSSCTVTLPAASSWTGREFTIKVITAHTVVSASSNVVPRNSATAGTAILAAAAGNWATLVSNGTNWVIMCGS